MIVLLAYSKCKLPMSLFENTLPNNATKFCINFGQYMQLITIDWADQNDTMAQQK